MSWQGDLRELVTVVHAVNCDGGYLPLPAAATLAAHLPTATSEWRDDLRTLVNLVEQTLADEYTCTHGHRA